MIFKYFGDQIVFNWTQCFLLSRQRITEDAFLYSKDWKSRDVLSHNLSKYLLNNPVMHFPIQSTKDLLLLEMYFFTWYLGSYPSQSRNIFITQSLEVFIRINMRCICHIICKTFRILESISHLADLMMLKVDESLVQNM